MDFESWRDDFNAQVESWRRDCKIEVQRQPHLLQLPDDTVNGGGKATTRPSPQKLESEHLDAQLLVDLISTADGFTSQIFPTPSHYFIEEKLEAELKKLKRSVRDQNVTKHCNFAVLDAFETWFESELKAKVTYLNDRRRRLSKTVSIEFHRTFGDLESRADYSWITGCGDFENFMQVHMNDSLVEKVLFESLGPEWVELYHELKTAKGRRIWKCLEWIQQYESEMIKKLDGNGYCGKDFNVELYDKEVLKTLEEVKFDGSDEKALRERTDQLLQEARNRMMQVNRERHALDKKLSATAVDHALKAFELELDSELSKPVDAASFTDLLQRKRNFYHQRFSLSRKPSGVVDEVWIAAAKTFLDEIDTVAKHRETQNEQLWSKRLNLHVPSLDGRKRHTSGTSADGSSKRPKPSPRSSPYDPHRRTSAQSPLETPSPYYSTPVFLSPYENLSPPPGVPKPDYGNPASDGLGLYVSKLHLHYAVGSRCNVLKSDFDLQLAVFMSNSSSPKASKIDLNLYNLLTHHTAATIDKAIQLEAKRVHPSVEAIAAALLTNLRQTVESNCKTPLGETLLPIAIPSTASSSTRHRFAMACAIAKIGNVVLVLPTTAIAIGYANDVSAETTDMYFCTVFMKPGLAEASVFKIDGSHYSSQAIRFSNEVPTLDSSTNINQAAETLQALILHTVQDTDFTVRGGRNCVLVVDGSTEERELKFAETLQYHFDKDPMTKHIRVVSKGLSILLIGLAYISSHGDPTELYREKLQQTETKVEIRKDLVEQGKAMLKLILKSHTEYRKK